MDRLATLLDWFANPDGWLLGLIGLLWAVKNLLIEDNLRVRAWTRRSVALMTLLYGLYAYGAYEPLSAEDYVHVTLRCLLVAGLANGLLALPLATIDFARVHVFVPTGERWRLRAQERTLRKEEARQQREHEKWLKQKQIEDEERKRELALQPPPPTRAERIKSAAALARQEFQAEAEAIRSAGLDEDEQDVALLEAQQKRSRRLKEIMR